MLAGTADFGDIALLKIQCSQTMEFCAREAMQILGGIGYMRGNRVERIYREVRVNAIGGGSEEIMRDLATRQYQL
jgi:acyl-CoA dehydrogenase